LLFSNQLAHPELLSIAKSNSGKQDDVTHRDMPVATISRLLGHASSTVTEKCYIKFREASFRAARFLMEQNACDVAEYVAKAHKNPREVKEMTLRGCKGFIFGLFHNKNTRFRRFLSEKMELMTGFEPVTSSLPRSRKSLKIKACREDALSCFLIKE